MGRVRKTRLLVQCPVTTTGATSSGNPVPELQIEHFPAIFEMQTLTIPMPLILSFCAALLAASVRCVCKACHAMLRHAVQVACANACVPPSIQASGEMLIAPRESALVWRCPIKQRRGHIGVSAALSHARSTVELDMCKVDRGSRTWQQRHWICRHDLIDAAQLVQCYLAGAAAGQGLGDSLKDTHTACNQQHLLFVVAQCLSTLVATSAAKLLGGHDILHLDTCHLSIEAFCGTYILQQCAWTSQRLVTALKPLATQRCVMLQPRLVRHPSGLRRVQKASRVTKSKAKPAKQGEAFAGKRRQAKIVRFVRDPRCNRANQIT